MNRLPLPGTDPFANMSDEANDRNERQMMRVIQVSGGLGLAVMAAILVSIKQVTPDLKFQFSFWTLPAFVLAMAFSWFFWRVVFREHDRAPGAVGRKRRRVLFVILSGILCLATLTAFGMSLKGVENERIMEIIQGAAVAVLTLTSLGFVLWQIARFLERDSRNASPTKKQPPEP